MTAIEICTCILIVSSAFTLVCLGIMLLRSIYAFRELGKTLEVSQSTFKKIDKVLDDVTYKMNLLNAPVESVARFFDPTRPKFSIVSTLMKLFNK